MLQNHPKIGSGLISEKLLNLKPTKQPKTNRSLTFSSLALLEKSYSNKLSNSCMDKYVFSIASVCTLNSLKSSFFVFLRLMALLITILKLDTVLAIAFALIAIEDEWMIAANSFFCGLRCNYIIRRVEPSVVNYINKVDLDDLLERHKEFNFHF